jgi:D-glycero-D-manno-heptose 1,7-bisphosphate phosphatase
MPELRSAHTGEPTVPVLYLDIDGTVRWGKDELGRFVNTKDDVRVFDEVPILLAGYKRLGWRIVGVSNQGGIALGYMDRRTCAQAMMETHRQTRHAFDRLTWCQHHPDAKDPEMAACWCRKPKPGLIIEAALDMARTHNEIYPPHLGLFVGDMDSDRECADNAGLRFMDAAEWRKGAHLAEIAR